MPRAPSQYPKRRLFVRSRKVSKPRDWYYKLSYRFKIWQAHRQHCCRSACQISERSDNSKYKSRGFETLRDLTERRLFGYWDGALIPCITMVLTIMVLTHMQDEWLPVFHSAVKCLHLRQLPMTHLMTLSDWTMSCQPRARHCQWARYK